MSDKPGDSHEGSSSQQPQSRVMSEASTEFWTQSHSSIGILEIRKERSRDAARSRRGKENYEFYELAKLLPLPGAITSQLDKASIIRLTISYLKLRDFSSHGDPPWNRDGPPPNKSVKGPTRGRNIRAVAMEIFETNQGSHILQSVDGFLFATTNDGRFLYVSETVSVYLGLSQTLDGFAFALTTDGRFLYVSETVSVYLGLSQVEMTGSSVFDYIHQQDHQELAEQLGLQPPQGGASLPSPGSSTSDDGCSTGGTPVSPQIHEQRGSISVMTPNLARGFDRSFCIRMKSTLTKRGVHVKTSGYRVVHILAHMRPQFTFSLSRKHPPQLMGLVGIALALPPPTINELRMENDMFVTRMGLDFKITYCEPRISELMNISSDDLTSCNLYDFVHAEDLRKLRKSHCDLLSKGQVLTEYYRLLNKHGGFVWIQTCAMMILNKNEEVANTVIGVNYVLSGVEYAQCVMDNSQMKLVYRREPDQSDHSGNESGSEHDPEKYNNNDPPNHDKSQSTGDTRTPDVSSKSQGRTHSSSHEPNVANQPIIEQKSPSILSLDNDTNELKENGNAVILGEEAIFGEHYRTDGKYSRRKMEKPRKRKLPLADDEIQSQISDCVDSTTNNGGSDSEVAANTNGLSLPVLDNGLGPHSDVSLSPRDAKFSKIQSPVPEDLTMRPRSASVQSPRTESQTPNSVGSRNSDPWAPETAVTSVRDLEKAMNKHLPTMVSEVESSQFNFQDEQYTGTLPKQSKSSTIQWIGSQASGGGLPATHLLRTLYANRESVIRPNIYTPRPPFFSELPSASMLTPPGEGYKEQPQFSLSQYTSSSTTAQPSAYVMSSYANAPITVAMTTTSLPEYNMTPPSSVSPQDKFQNPFSDPSGHGFSQIYPGPPAAHSGSYDRSLGNMQYQPTYYSHGSYSTTYTSASEYNRDKPSPWT